MNSISSISFKAASFSLPNIEPIVNYEYHFGALVTTNEITHLCAVADLLILGGPAFIYVKPEIGGGRFSNTDMEPC